MNRYQIAAAGMTSLLVIAPAGANVVTELDLQDMQGFADAPVVHVYSTDGEKWNEVDKNKTTSFRLGFSAACKWPGKNHKAYEGSFNVEGFSIVGNVHPEKKGASIHTAQQVKADLRWQGGAGSFDPVEICNSELDKRVSTQPGKSKYEWLAKGFKVDYPGAVMAKYILTCHATGLGFSDFADNPAKVNVRVVCAPSAEAQAKIPKPEPKTKQSKLVPAIKTLNLKLKPANYQGTCPVKVGVDAVVTLNYPAEVKYQYIGDKGHKSPVFTLRNKGKAGSWNLAPWSRRIEPPSTIGKLSIGPHKGGYKHQGWMKIRVLSPKPMTSKVAAFKVQCVNMPQGAPGKLAPPRPRPEPKGLELKSDSKASPARTHKPREIVVVGSKAKKKSAAQPLTTSPGSATGTKPQD